MADMCNFNPTWQQQATTYKITVSVWFIYACSTGEFLFVYKTNIFGKSLSNTQVYRLTMKTKLEKLNY